ncbi:phospholipase D-like domain-containing protein [Cystobacter ferrugineus]|uniref:Cardiolipin synthase B n=1 Tax=Cystobacter ferrugineus TaxID=83449 RepID=A0A1L9BK95_9BACT|nr:phospholipase D-like domain-containing protein [Cystobacter ferrugineus]OJH42667.1 cardiolipin synthase B [Cystobacter ferrugineus]
MQPDTSSSTSARWEAPDTGNDLHEMRGPVALPPGFEAFCHALYQSTRLRLEPGHRVELVKNGVIFEQICETIRQATESVHILVFIWRPSEPSDRIVEALCERARAGVACRVIVDPVGSEEVNGEHDFNPRVEKRLREGGVEVHYFRPLSGRWLGRLFGRTHHKLVIVDGKVGFTGGFGIWKSWQGDGQCPEEWRDTNVRVEGPTVREMQLAFARSWQECGGALLPESCFPRIPRGGDAHATFVESAGVSGISDAERMLRMVFAAARERLWISNAYFTPPNAILEQLLEKRKQGVDVRVLAAGPVHDWRIVRASQRATYEKLLEGGIRIWEYQPSMLHSKTVLADDWLSVVGSTNMDALSLHRMREGSLVVADRRLASHLEEAWSQDMTCAEEITLQRRGRTNPWRRFARRVTQLLAADR